MRALLALMAATAVVAPTHPQTWTEPALSAQTAQAVQKAQAGDFSELIQAADAGHADAQVRLGRAHMSGAKGLAADKAKACAYQEKAAASRADAMYLAGLCRQQGLGGAKPDARAARGWYEKAAARNFPPAQRTLGEMYARGEGGKKDKKKAIEMWVAADKAGDNMVPILMGDFLFGELTGGKTPGPGKFRIPAGAPLGQVKEAAAWYEAAAQRDPRPEVRQRATTAVSVLTQLEAGLKAKGHAP